MDSSEPTMDDRRMDRESKQEQISDGSNNPEVEGGPDQGEIMDEDDVLEEIEDDQSPENG